MAFFPKCLESLIIDIFVSVENMYVKLKVVPCLYFSSGSTLITKQGNTLYQGIKQLVIHLKNVT